MKTNDHTTAIVPIETWAYQSPRLRRLDQAIDMGLFAESLIYYDRVLIVPATNIAVGRVLSEAERDGKPILGTEGDEPAWPGFLEFVNWFAARGLFSELLALVNDGTVSVYHYAFHTVPIIKDGSYSLWNAQDAEEAAGPTFHRRILGHRSLEAIVPRARHREQLHRALDRRIVEAHSSDFDRAVENARKDFGDADAAIAAVQAVVNEIYDLAGYAAPPQVEATITRLPNGDSTIKFNLDFQIISRGLAPKMRFDPGTPLCGIAHSNRLLWSAALSSVDLYLPDPVSPLVQSKLQESNERRTGPRQIVDQLKSAVEFPDVRSAVNSGDLSFIDVMRIREKAKPFRSWLQLQTDRDRDAIIAYHNEVARESGFTRGARKILKVFGCLGGAAAGAAVGAALGPPGATLGAVVGAAVSTTAADEGVRYVFDLAGKLDEDWRPVVFGSWAEDLVNRKIAERRGS